MARHRRRHYHRRHNPAAPSFFHEHPVVTFFLGAGALTAVGYAIYNTVQNASSGGAPSPMTPSLPSSPASPQAQGPSPVYTIPTITIPGTVPTPGTPPASG
jgi:hypothetical protein